ncbi:MAG: Holliday junction branch migration protein RuvA [Succinivibrionaceae bacterium]|nr:Holliday junction branch migration protein RuvA [Succinivibrionaceae bacterium]
MIGSLRGRVLRIDGMVALIECGGVGHEVELPIADIAGLTVDAEAFVYVHQVIREDASLLFGFTDLKSRALFRELIRVNGVGARTALAALSALDADSLLGAIASGKSSVLQRIPGVGKKTAERIVIDLKDRLAAFAPQDGAVAQGEPGPDGAAVGDAINALIGLGYKESHCKALVEEVARAGMSTQDIIVAALALNSGKK